ncbi:MAG: fructosamine kinase family protein [Actinobacteria bacterium]|nr:fructosamine kinase family protein [Actinomycetota bacterium]
MSLSSDVLEALGGRVAGVERVGGGDINEGWRVVFTDGRRSFVKTRADPGVGEYAAEAAGLGWLKEAGGLQVPDVRAVGDDFLELDWIEPGRLDPAGAGELGRGLAAVHAAGAEGFGGPGPLRIGRLEVPNAGLPTWPEFYAERRLRPLAGAARLSGRGARALERVCDRIEDLAGPAEPVARVHGDLWSGNVLAGEDGRPWLIDPIAHGGHREVDLAMLALFGGPPPGTLEAYAQAAPLADGWEDRVGLWQLFPLLVHAVLFGGSYPAWVERIAVRYAG